MKTLIVEDDFISRRVLQTFLAPYGACEVAINGNEGIEAFVLAHEEKEPYDLICLDIMMPGIVGLEVLEKIRDYEKEHGITSFDGVKIIMTTALSGYEDIKRAFKGQCESYMIKPIIKEKLIATLDGLGLIEGRDKLD